MFFFNYIAVSNIKTTNIYPRPADSQLSMVFYNFHCFLLMSANILNLNLNIFQYII